MSKLHILDGEFAAGNETTRNQIVAILDFLRERNELSEADYRYTNSLLQSDLNYKSDNKSDSKAVSIEDVAEHLIPIDGDYGGTSDIEHMIRGHP